MAVTKGAMNSFPLPQTFLESVEKSEDNGINFRDSLKFFQEQLVINGANFPSPSRLGNQSRPNKEDNSTKNREEPRKSLTIQIPTVDTILESVRVLRAIQKSQEERNTLLHASLNADLQRDSSIQVSDLSQQACSWTESFSSTDSTNIQPDNSGEVDDGFEHSKQDSRSNSNTINEVCSFWPSSAVETGSNWEINNSSCPIESQDTQVVSCENYEIKQIDNTELLEYNYEVERNGDSFEHDNLLCESFSNHDFTGETKICTTKDSLEFTSKDILNDECDRTSNNESNSTTIALEEQEFENMPLKIDFYEYTSSLRPEDYLSDEYILENCSPRSKEVLQNDSYLDIITSNLLTNNPSEIRNDSYSDTGSSIYVSAECSPCHSLNNTFESQLELKTALGLIEEIENADILVHLTSNELKSESEKDTTEENCHTHLSFSELPNQTNEEKELTSNEEQSDTQNGLSEIEFKFLSENTSVPCTSISNNTIENSLSKENEQCDAAVLSESCYASSAGSHIVCNNEKISCDIIEETRENESTDVEEENDSRDLSRKNKFSVTAWDLIPVLESLYTIKENPAYQGMILAEGRFEETLFVLSKGAFYEHPEDNYVVIIEDSNIHILKDSENLLSMNMKYGVVSFQTENVLEIDNKMGRCVYFRCDSKDIVNLKSKIESHCLKHWLKECLQLVHYPLKCHQNVVVIDLGSCATRAGILMDQPTLPSLFFPTVCATDKETGTCLYGMEALQPEVRKYSTLSFPVRPTNKITKHTIDIDSLEGLFKKVFNDLKVDPTQYTIQVCLPRNLSINAQNALLKLLLEDLKVKAVSLTNQALLTLYAHDVSTAVVVDIGDRTDVLPVVDGFIVENGVTRLPHGGQRLIHHMKNALAEKLMILSNDIDSFVVQYIIENLAYVAEDYEYEVEKSSQNRNIISKTTTLQPRLSESESCRSITLEEARFKITEGLFNPELWGLDSPGIHQLVQKAILATNIDARKQIAANIYISGGVTMLPGFAERLNKEVAKLSKPNIVPKVIASNYRYHCTYIGACKFSKMEVFPQVCVNFKEYSQNGASALKKCALFF